MVSVQYIINIKKIIAWILQIILQSAIVFFSLRLKVSVFR